MERGRFAHNSSSGGMVASSSLGASLITEMRRQKNGHHCLGRKPRPGCEDGKDTQGIRLETVTSRLKPGEIQKSEKPVPVPPSRPCSSEHLLEKPGGLYGLEIRAQYLQTAPSPINLPMVRGMDREALLLEAEAMAMVPY